MRFTAASAFLAALPLLLSSFPPTALADRSQQRTAESLILEIMPKSASCAPENDECTTAAQAAPFLIAAMDKYNIRDAPEIAAILATIATESAQLQYRTNQFPGRPGQGTSNMQMYEFNYEFALSIPELKPQVEAISGPLEPGQASDETMNAVRGLVITDEYNFQTGPWYYDAHCDAELKKALRTSTGAALDQAFSDYSLGCIGAASLDDGRGEFFHAAKKAFGLS